MRGVAVAGADALGDGDVTDVHGYGELDVDAFLALALRESV